MEAWVVATGLIFVYLLFTIVLVWAGILWSGFWHGIGEGEPILWTLPLEANVSLMDIIEKKYS